MNTPLLAVDIIKKTRDRMPLTEEEIHYFVMAYTKGEIPDYQMSAWLMAVRINGLRPAETLALTKTMLRSGLVIDLSEIQLQKIDKHSTGGIGDKTSLILGPIVAACGVAVPMMSGRGLGHTGGTLDKLESIPGFDTQLELARFKTILKKQGVSFIGQTKDICPADKKMYALRDVTGTIESLPLISASIMSKKLAEDLDGLVLDVKFGSGAFMKTIDAAKELALSLQGLGKGAGKKVTAFLTNMEQPLGAYIGNSLEIYECLEIMKGNVLTNKVGTDLFADTRELSVVLAAEMLVLAGAAKDLEQGKSLANDAITSGRALKIFEEVCREQGGNLSALPVAPVQITVRSPRSGFIAGFHGEKIGMLGIKIGAGRKAVTDPIDPISGFQIHSKLGDAIEEGDALWTLYGSSKESLEAIIPELIDTVFISDKKPAKFELIHEILK